ncbi:S1C family serine protease [Amphibacillus cookii]|uniref:S1C family serine protease n=1 Tax=Amphibacillus cookii TaxID=767787 RepID=UPI0019565D9F|nr:serine protease [Amphibacillus cookii]MBM7540061.1 S1-C subfamily serine protease [Amphibacillus cookii]
MDQKKNNHDSELIDQDLYEDLDPDTMLELLEEEQRSKQKEEEKPAQSSFPRWLIWLVAFTLILNVIALIPRTFSIPALEFLSTSAELSVNEDIQLYKESIVVIETSNSKGTGFSITNDGYILTNEHVVAQESYVTVSFPEQGLYQAEVVQVDEALDLALLKVAEDDLPFLDLAENTEGIEQTEVYFIGNPLRFNGIANQGMITGFIEQMSLATEVMMIDAPVYRGNSGSPVINQDGEVIGMIYATLNDEQYGRVGLAIPVDAFHHIISSSLVED